MDPWWVRHPGRLQYEINRFQDDLGLKVQVEERGRSVALHTTVFGGGRWVDIEIVYPPLFPDVAPSVLLLGEQLGRHHGWGGHVCLTPQQDGNDWWPWYSAAEGLLPRFRRLLDDMEAGPDAVAEAEVDWAEPATAFYTYDDDTFVLLPEGVWQRDLPATRGTAQLHQWGQQVWVADGVQARGEQDLLIAERPPEVATLLGSKPRTMQRVRWYDIGQAPGRKDFTDGMLDGVQQLGLKGARAIFRSAADGGKSHLLLLTFLEEGPKVGQQRRTWVAGTIYAARTGGLHYPIALHAVQELSQRTRSQRLPDLERLGDAHIVVLGAGSLGSPVALELAKAGVGRLTIVDPDTFDVGNCVRHALPMAAAGLNKAAAVGQLAEQRNPFIDVTPVPGFFGKSAGSTTADEDPVAMDALAAADLVIDTTGSGNAARAATAVRRDKGGVVVAGLTLGALGGEILIHRRQGPCFLCFKLHQNEGSLNRPPAAAHDGPVTPVGCSAPTFTGPGFEATALATEVVRTAVRALGCTPYPDLQHNWQLLDFRGDTGDTGRLHVHADCPNHG